MSAIWGIVDFEKESVNEELARRMEKLYYTYKIDVFKKYIAKDAIFGYGGQYFTKEARNEILPIVDDTDKVLFVADVVLDNREELFDMLGIKLEDRNDIPDGTLMYQILRKYEKESYNMFLGTYAFAYYDKVKKEVLLVTDAVGSRSLYYYYDQGKLYFSTLMKPILEVNKVETEWNYRFLSDVLALNNLALYTEAEETPYQNLYKVAPGQAVIIKEQGLYKEDYWKLPINIKPARKSDEEYKKEFIKLFDTCVSSVMRSSEKTGVLLSGGLDSTSVACFAAPKLKDKGEMLYSYTSIPEKEYVSKELPYYITNEQKMVEITKDYLGNLSCTFLELPGVNGFDGATEYMERLELPYKSLQNIRWIRASAEEAAKDGCRILLTGKYGNSTISFGNYEKYFSLLIKSAHFIELVKEVNAFGRKYHVRRKRIYRYILANAKSNIFKKKLKVEDMFANVYVNPELIKQYDTEKRFRIYNIENGHALTMHDRTDLAFKTIFIQMGELETRLSLDTGVLQRDPTRDKRMIEYCMKLPENQFVYRGIERRLVREYLESYLPKDIITDYKHRGMQSADTIERIEKNWTQIYQECSVLLKDKRAAKLLDLPKIKLRLESYKEELPADEVFEVLKLLYSILLVRYAFE